MKFQQRRERLRATDKGLKVVVEAAEKRERERVVEEFFVKAPSEPCGSPFPNITRRRVGKFSSTKEKLNKEIGEKLSHLSAEKQLGYR